ncbi:MAG: hypothetical protein IJ180_05610 [Bacteroidales bacterium]|nr:hypothetical protein [Bacteroidales bacterium]
MYDHKIHYCFTLSEEQMKYLRSKKYKIDRMECFMSLVELAERETKLVQISKVQQVEILPDQVMVDNTQLAKLWDKDRKTVPKLIEAMEALGISSSQKVGDNRIHTLHTFSGWYVDGRFVKNPFATRRNADASAIITAEVPPAKVITIEVLDDKNMGNEGSNSDSDNSQVGNVGMIQSSDGDMSHSSLQSNNSSDLGKSVAVVQSSVSSHCDNSAHSDSTPSSYAEADGSQNGGKRKDEPPAQQGGLPLQPDGIPSNGNGGCSQRSDGYNHTNGYQSDK